MTVSLMSMLGGRINLSVGGSEKNEPGKVELQSNGGDAAFETIMAASEQKEISAQELREFFASQGIDVDVLQHGLDGIDFMTAINQVAAAQAESAAINQEDALAQVVAQIAAAQPQIIKNPTTQVALPSDVAVTVQEILSVNADLTDNKTAEDTLSDLIAQLPERELTAEELSSIVQVTGIPPVVIFDALQNTPAASPNLAAAMVDDMGEVAKDAGLPFPKPVRQAAATPSVIPNETAADTAIAGDSVDGAESDLAPVASPKVASELSPEQQKVIQKIINVLQGGSEEAELPEEWLSRLAALSTQSHASVKTEVATPDAVPTVRKIAGNDNAVAQKNLFVSPEAGIVPETAVTYTKPEPVQYTATNEAIDPNVHAKASVAAPAVQISATVDGTVSATAAVVAEQLPVAKNTVASADAVKFAQQPIVPDETATEQVTVRLKQAVSTGESVIQIRLKPVELGGVDVKIETGADGRSQIHVTAEKRDTLDMLQRDARSLERALLDIGFKADNSSLSFNMRGGDQQQNQQAQQFNDQGQGKGQFSLDGGYANEDAAEQDLPLAYDVSRAYSLTLDRGVDISV